MKKIIALCAFCLYINGTAQEEVTPEPATTEQDLQPIEEVEELTDEAEEEAPLFITPPKPEVIEESATPASEESANDSEEGEKWYDFSDQMNQQAEAKDSMREVKQANRYKMNTIMDSQRFALGAFIEQTSKVTQIDGDMHLLLGGRFSLVFNHHLNIGLAGYGLVSPVDWVPDSSLPGDYLLFGYGGLMIEPEFAPQRVIHVGIPMLLGAGGFGTRDDDFNTYENGDACWVFEPGLNIDINIARFFKIGLGGSYRLVSNSIADNHDLDKLSGANANLSFKLGWF